MRYEHVNKLMSDKSRYDGRLEEIWWNWGCLWFKIIDTRS